MSLTAVPPPAPAADGGTVLITGISGWLGRLLARRLHRTHAVEGADRRPLQGAPKDVIVHAVDYRKKKIEDLFRGRRVDAVYHLALTPARSMREQAEQLEGTQNLVDFADRWGANKLVVVTSVTVYGALPTNSYFRREDAPLLGGASSRVQRSIVEIDMLAQSFFWKHPRLRTVILRPVHVLGPHARGPFADLLRKNPVPLPMGFDPPVQVMHESDLVNALVACLKPEAAGIYNIVGAGSVPVSVATDTLRRPVLPVPHPLLPRLLREWERLSPRREALLDVDYLRFPCHADGARADRDLGYRPRVGLGDTILSMLQRE